MRNRFPQPFAPPPIRRKSHSAGRTVASGGGIGQTPVRVPAGGIFRRINFVEERVKCRMARGETGRPSARYAEGGRVEGSRNNAAKRRPSEKNGMDENFHTGGDWRSEVPVISLTIEIDDPGRLPAWK